MRQALLRVSALSLACVAGAALAADGFGPLAPASVAPAPVYTYESMAPGSPIHSGGASAADTSLALDVAAALAADPKLEGATITVSSRNGNVSLSGSALSPEQGAYAENAARRVAGVGSVSGTLSSQGG
jgi:osmotically-inducible protein OsmY